MTASWDAVVVGTGPAGIAGATRLAEAGLKVLAVDEAPAPGGQIWRGIETIPDSRATVLGKTYMAGKAPVARLRASPATLRLSAQLWRAETDGTVWLRDSNGISKHNAACLLVATGAIERPIPRPGWTLPGVTTIGALQILLKREGILPDGPLLLAGTGPLFYLYAHQCLMAGKRNIVLVDTASPVNWLPSLRFFPQALLGEGPSYLFTGVSLFAAFLRHHVKMIVGARDLQIKRSTDGRIILHYRRGKRRHQLEAAHIGLHEGVIPETHLTRSLGCDHEWSKAGQAFIPSRNGGLQSSAERIFIAGDAGGIGGASVASIEGDIAALSILGHLRRGGDNERQMRRLQSARAAHLAPRPFLDRLYWPGTEALAPPDDAIVCRCEEITSGEIRAALQAGAHGPNQIKAFLRPGMGPCQGRLCGPLLTALTMAEHGISPEDAGALSVRSPLRPVSVGELASLHDQNTNHSTDRVS